MSVINRPPGCCMGVGMRGAGGALYPGHGSHPLITRHGAAVRVRTRRLGGVDDSRGLRGASAIHTAHIKKCILVQ